MALQRTWRTYGGSFGYFFLQYGGSFGYFYLPPERARIARDDAALPQGAVQVVFFFHHAWDASSASPITVPSLHFVFRASFSAASPVSADRGVQVSVFCSAPIQAGFSAPRPFRRASLLHAHSGESRAALATSLISTHFDVATSTSLFRSRRFDAPAQGVGTASHISSHLILSN